jgi:hypothetical protein
MLQGYQGGRAAAQQLTQRIAAQLSSEEVHVYGRLSFWITIYFNKAELAEDLSASNICPLEQFHAFVTVSERPTITYSTVAIHLASQGFTHASPRFTTVDTGYGYEPLDAKIQGEYYQPGLWLGINPLQNIFRLSHTYRKLCVSSLAVCSVSSVS